MPAVICQAVKQIKPLMLKALFILDKRADKVLMATRLVIPPVLPELCDESAIRSKSRNVADVFSPGREGWGNSNLL